MQDLQWGKWQVWYCPTPPPCHVWGCHNVACSQKPYDNNSKSAQLLYQNNGQNQRSLKYNKCVMLKTITQKSYESMTLLWCRQCQPDAMACGTETNMEGRLPLTLPQHTFKQHCRWWSRAAHYLEFNSGRLELLNPHFVTHLPMTPALHLPFKTRGEFALLGSPAHLDISKGSMTMPLPYHYAFSCDAKGLLSPSPPSH